MSMTAIRAAIVARLSAVAGVQNVHAFERFAVREPELRAFYAAAGPAPQPIHGWFVRRRGFRNRLLPSGRMLVRAEWQMVGYLSLIDDTQSELGADGLADAIAAAFAAEPTLGDLVRGVPVDGRAGVALAELLPVMMAGVLCHRVILELATEHYEPFADPTGDLSLSDLARPDWKLVSAVVDRLTNQAMPPLASVEGRLAWDGDDDPFALPGVVVVPFDERGNTALTTTMMRDVVTVGVGVIITGPSGFLPGQGAAAADGLAALRLAVRESLHGWGEGGATFLDVPLAYAGSTPVPAPIGRVAWRDLYQGELIVEAS